MRQRGIACSWACSTELDSNNTRLPEIIEHTKATAASHILSEVVTSNTAPWTLQPQQVSQLAYQRPHDDLFAWSVMLCNACANMEQSARKESHGFLHAAAHQSSVVI